MGSDAQHAGAQDGRPTSAPEEEAVVTAFHAAVAAARLSQADQALAQPALAASEDEPAATVAWQSPAQEGAASAADTTQAAAQHPEQALHGKASSTPVPRRKGAGRLWQVSVGRDGVMEGCQGPPQVSADTELRC